MIALRIPEGLEIENLNIAQSESLSSVTIDKLNPTEGGAGVGGLPPVLA